MINDQGYLLIGEMITFLSTPSVREVFSFPPLVHRECGSRLSEQMANRSPSQGKYSPRASRGARTRCFPRDTVVEETEVFPTIEDPVGYPSTSKESLAVCQGALSIPRPLRPPRMPVMRNLNSFWNCWLSTFVVSFVIRNRNTFYYAVIFSQRRFTGAGTQFAMDEGALINLYHALHSSAKGINTGHNELRNRRPVSALLSGCESRQVMASCLERVRCSLRLTLPLQFSPSLTITNIRHLSKTVGSSPKERN